MSEWLTTKNIAEGKYQEIEHLSGDYFITVQSGITMLTLDNRLAFECNDIEHAKKIASLYGNFDTDDKRSAGKRRTDRLIKRMVNND